MDALVKARWVVLGLALTFGLVSALPWVAPAVAINWTIPLDVTLIGAALLQGVGTFAMQRAGAGWFSLACGYVSAFAWIVAELAGIAAVQAGPGGLVYGLLIMMPATGLALLTQFGALIGFSRQRSS